MILTKWIFTKVQTQKCGPECPRCSEEERTLEMVFNPGDPDMPGEVHSEQPDYLVELAAEIQRGLDYLHKREPALAPPSEGGPTVEPVFPQVGSKALVTVIIETGELPKITKFVPAQRINRHMEGEKCATCPSEKTWIVDFRDTLSVREYGISRMCQVCQDTVFGCS